MKRFHPPTTPSDFLFLFAVGLVLAGLYLAIRTFSDPKS